VAETHAKAAGLLKALGLAEASGQKPSPGTATGDPRIRQALADRNTTLSRFWFDGAGGADGAATAYPELSDRTVLVVDGEDAFTAMLGHQLRGLGLRTTIARFDQDHDPAGFDFAVVGPGPGDPCDATDPRIGAVRALTRRLLAGGVPFLSICLGHQVLCVELGFEVIRRAEPNQGVQRLIDLFGRPERVGFYNTYSALARRDFVTCERLPEPVRVSRDHRTGEVHALRGPGFRSVQFHPESVLTQNGPRILGEMLTSLTSFAPVA
jgi:phenazine biosynthesis protein phzE